MLIRTVSNDIAGLDAMATRVAGLDVTSFQDESEETVGVDVAAQDLAATVPGSSDGCLPIDATATPWVEAMSHLVRF